MNTLAELYEAKKKCQACHLRAGCHQVVVGTGRYDSPALVVVGEAPGENEDLEGEPFVGMAGQLLREVLRETRILNRRNTLVTNILGCRPPKNKFPKDDSPSICMAKWLSNEISIAKPRRMLLLGGQALWHVAGLEGITACRGQWYNAMGVRTMATYHPSYVLRCEGDGKMSIRKEFEGDIMEVASEVASLQKASQEAAT
jgi:DNA polymerase